MADVYSKKKRSEIMSRVRAKGTGPEQAVAAILRILGIRFACNVKSLPGCPDFTIPSQRTVIFVHGCYWHRHHNCKRATIPRTNREFWFKKLTGNARRDRRNARKLRADGWRVLTVWQCRLRKPDAVVRRLRRLLT